MRDSIKFMLAIMAFTIMVSTALFILFAPAIIIGYTKNLLWGLPYLGYVVSLLAMIFEEKRLNNLVKKV